MGRVIDRTVAKETPCHGYEIDGEYMLWSTGVIGTLSDSQEKIFCNPRKLKKATPKALKERLKTFQKIANKCEAKAKDLPPGKRFKKYTGCMSERLEEEGIELE